MRDQSERAGPDYEEGSMRDQSERAGPDYEEGPAEPAPRSRLLPLSFTGRSRWCSYTFQA
jgi:hypothetical protein